MKRLVSRALIVLVATPRHPLFAVWVPWSWVTAAARKQSA